MIYKSFIIGTSGKVFGVEQRIGRSKNITSNILIRGTVRDVARH